MLSVINFVSSSTNIQSHQRINHYSIFSTLLYWWRFPHRYIGGENLLCYNILTFILRNYILILNIKYKLMAGQ